MELFAKRLALYPLHRWGYALGHYSKHLSHEEHAQAIHQAYLDPTSQPNHEQHSKAPRDHSDH